MSAKDKSRKKDKARKPDEKSKRVPKKSYLEELARLQTELVKLQEWVKREGLKIVVIFEGRDAAGKGGVIKRITQKLNPRVCRVVALGTPTEREKTQWYFQRVFGPQFLVLVEKASGGQITTRQLLPVRFVPLTRESQ